MPSKPLIATMPFEYPTHGYHFADTLVYIYEREEKWRLCRRLGCPTCLASPEAFVFHIECFRLVRQTAEKQINNEGAQAGNLYDTLWRIWLAGHWSRPWTKLFYQVRQQFCRSPSSIAKIQTLDRTLVSLLDKIELLPPELFRMIVAYCPDSLY